MVCSNRSTDIPQSKVYQSAVSPDLQTNICEFTLLLAFEISTKLLSHHDSHIGEITGNASPESGDWVVVFFLLRRQVGHLVKGSNCSMYLAQS